MIGKHKCGICNFSEKPSKKKYHQSAKNVTKIQRIQRNVKFGLKTKTHKDEGWISSKWRGKTERTEHSKYRGKKTWTHQPTKIPNQTDIQVVLVHSPRLLSPFSELRFFFSVIFVIHSYANVNESSICRLTKKKTISGIKTRI